MYISLSLLSCIYSRVFGRVTGCVVDVHTVQNQVVRSQCVNPELIPPHSPLWGSMLNLASTELVETQRQRSVPQETETRQELDSYLTG